MRPATLAGRFATRDPDVVGPFDLGEDRREDPGSVDLCARLEAEGRGRRLGFGRELVGRLIHVHPDPQDDAAVARLGQNPRHLLSVDEHVVRELHRRRDACRGGQGIGDRTPGDERELGKAGWVDLRPEQDRHEDGGPGRGLPASAESPAALGLLLGDRDRSLHVVGLQQPLRGGAGVGVSIRVPEPAPQERLHEFGSEGVGHDPRLDLAMKLSGRRARPIERPFRPEGPLVHARLSDPILVRRAKDGDRRALEVLCERHAPRVERLAAHLLRDPEDARDAAQESLAKLCIRLRQFRGDSQFSTWLHRLVVNTCRDVASRQRARACEPLLEDRRAATDGDPVRAADLAELRGALGARLAEIAPDQARVVAMKDALDFSFEEIAAATGMPVGTAKCYAHRGRNRLRDKLEDVA